MSINEILPEEILGKIFSYINVRDRLLFLNNVCFKWRKVVHFTDVKTLDIFELHDDICLLDFECPFRLASNRPSDHPLPEVWLLKFLSSILPQFGASLKSLSFQIQRFSNIQFLSIGIEIMELVLRTCPKLVELNFLRCQLTPAAVSVLPLFTELESLKLIRQDVCDQIWPLLLENKLLKLETSNKFGRNFLETTGENLETLHLDSMSDDVSVDFPLHEIVERYPKLIELNIRNLSNVSGTHLQYVAELKQLKILTFQINERTGVSFFPSICNKCHFLEDLTIFDHLSDGALNLDGLINGPGIKLKKFSFNSMKTISVEQLKLIKQMRYLQTLMLRTNKLPPNESSCEKSNCSALEELAISSTNQAEKSYQYQLFLNNCGKLSKIGYLPRGWALHGNDGVEPEILQEYLTRVSGEKHLIKLLIYANDAEKLTSLTMRHFPELTGIIIFGNSFLTDQATKLISVNFPRLSYIMAENHIEITSDGVVNLLKCRQLTELHAKYKDLEVDGKICYAIGYSSSLKRVSFRGILMATKVRLHKKEWDSVLSGRNDLFREGRTCQRVFIDCWYFNVWPKELATTFRRLWISCKAAKQIEIAHNPSDVITVPKTCTQ